MSASANPQRPSQTHTQEHLSGEAPVLLLDQKHHLGSEQLSGGAELHQLFVRAEVGISYFQRGESQLPRRFPGCRSYL